MFASLAVGAPASVALAASPSVVVVGTEEDPFARQVQAELEAMGFNVVMVEATSAPVSRATLEGAARSKRAVAAIRGVPTDDGIEVWIADRVTGKTVLRQVSAAGSERGSAALRVVELLRASMLETALPAPTRGDVAATPEITDKLVPPELTSALLTASPRLRVWGALGVLGSPGGFGPSASADIGLSWMPSEHIGVSALGVFSISRPSVGTQAESANLWTGLGGAGARFQLTSQASPWAPTLDVGLAAVFVTSEGSAGPMSNVRATTATSVSAAPYLRLGLGYALLPMLRLQLAGLASVVPQDVQVQFVGKTVATWGQPILGASLGVDVGVF